MTHELWSFRWQSVGIYLRRASSRLSSFERMRSGVEKNIQLCIIVTGNSPPLKAASCRERSGLAHYADQK
jgi:hypothetical protein